MTVADTSFWRRCSSCKREIAFQATYWVCNVSTCNRKRTGLVFCTTSCWDAHLPLMNHRESWAEERRAPTREAWLRERARLRVEALHHLRAVCEARTQELQGDVAAEQMVDGAVDVAHAA